MVHVWRARVQILNQSMTRSTDSQREVACSAGLNGKHFQLPCGVTSSLGVKVFPAYASINCSGGYLPIYPFIYPRECIPASALRSQLESSCLRSLHNSIIGLLSGHHEETCHILTR